MELIGRIGRRLRKLPTPERRVELEFNQTEGKIRVKKVRPGKTVLMSVRSFQQEDPMRQRAASLSRKERLPLVEVNSQGREVLRSRLRRVFRG